MKTFRMVADCTFLAKDIDDAFNKMAWHFHRLREPNTLFDVAGESSVLTGGSITIEPLTEK